MDFSSRGFRGNAPCLSPAFSHWSGRRSGLAFLLQPIGVYEAFLDGRRVGDFIMAPGWTKYARRHQYQTYELGALGAGEHTLTVTVAPGWYRGRLGWGDKLDSRPERKLPAAMIAQLDYETDGVGGQVNSDARFEAGKGPLTFCEIYDGEEYDARIVPSFGAVRTHPEITKDNLMAQQGEKVIEHERLHPRGAPALPRKASLCWISGRRSQAMCASVSARTAATGSACRTRRCSTGTAIFTERITAVPVRPCFIPAERDSRYISRD